MATLNKTNKWNLKAIMILMEKSMYSYIYFIEPLNAKPICKILIYGLFINGVEISFKLLHTSQYLKTYISFSDRCYFCTRQQSYFHKSVRISGWADQYSSSELAWKS